MEYLPSDRDWGDYHAGKAPERASRYRQVMDSIMEDLIPILREHSHGRAINAMVPEDLFAVGVGGDSRIYAPFVILTYDEIPSYEELGAISQAITNSLPISRVTVSITHKVVATERAQFIVSRAAVPA
jgi:hypothetical protein